MFLILTYRHALDLDCASRSAGTAPTVFDYDEITIVQQIKSDLVKLEGIRSDNKLIFSPIIN